jgi:hypothetical protein
MQIFIITVESHYNQENTPERIAQALNEDIDFKHANTVNIKEIK